MVTESQRRLPGARTAGRVFHKGQGDLGDRNVLCGGHAGLHVVPYDSCTSLHVGYSLAG